MNPRWIDEVRLELVTKYLQCRCLGLHVCCEKCGLFSSFDVVNEFRTYV